MHEVTILYDLVKWLKLANIHKIAHAFECGTHVNIMDHEIKIMNYNQHADEITKQMKMR
jgi:hypothetical protein